MIILQDASVTNIQSWWLNLYIVNLMILQCYSQLTSNVDTYKFTLQPDITLKHHHLLPT
jgi:hypothetical protein